MAKTSNFVKTKVKFEVQRKSRCMKCGRSHGYLRRFNLCRICFRDLAHLGLLPGVKKASW